ncbi:MAG TPA: hypothetical protein PLV11_10125 [Phycicoccus elongatus]|mgnify:FL=1|jgi:hypothetical protein|nr:hypothetical protein [Phycicoccus elongatus]
MSPASHPSAFSPAAPEVHVELAAGWTQVPAGADLVRFERHGGRAVLTVALRTVGRDVTLEDLLDEMVAGEHARPDAQVDPTFGLEIDGRAWRACNVSWDTPVVVVHLVTAIDHGPVQQMVLVSGRAEGEQVEADYDAIQQLAESLHVVVSHP